MSMKPVYRADEALAWAILQKSPAVHVAGVGPGRRPVLRTLHGAVRDRTLLFHGGDHGDKLGLVGQRVTVTAERLIARIPSTFIHPNIACPATTYYESVHAEGVFEPIVDLSQKAEALQAFMEHFQPEGGFTPLSAEHATYRSALKTLLVAKIVPTYLSAKRKLGQNRSAPQILRVAECLWHRGEPGDLEAIEPVLFAHPAAPWPSFLCGPGEVRLCPALDAAALGAVQSLLRGQYWLEGIDGAAIARAHLESDAWVGARAPDGQLIGSARAISDGVRVGYVADVVVHPNWRRRGIATAMMRLLLDHPRVRAVRNLRLATRDAAPLYAAFGFLEESPRYTAMIRRAS